MLTIARNSEALTLFVSSESSFEIRESKGISSLASSPKEIAAVNAVMADEYLGMGKYVNEFETALKAYAAMMNTLDSSKLESLLAENFHYASQMVFSEIESKQEYMAYIKPKLEAVGRSGSKVWAEMGRLETGFPGPCVVLAQGDKENLVALVLAEVEGDLITRIDMCIAPTPQSANRTGEYPL